MLENIRPLLGRGIAAGNSYNFPELPGSSAQLSHGLKRRFYMGFAAKGEGTHNDLNTS